MPVVAAAVWVCALLSVFAPEVSWALVALCLAATLGVVTFARNRGVLVLALLACSAVAWSAGAAATMRAEAAQWDGRVIEAQITVTSQASQGSDGRLWADALTTRLGSPGAAAPQQVPVRIGVDAAEATQVGADVKIVGQAMATDAGEAPVLVIFTTSASVIRPATGLFAVTSDLREAFVERATRLPGSGGRLLPGLAVGDTRAVDENVDAAMLTSGLSHLTAVSGANCAIVVAAVFWVVAICGGPRWLRVVLALGALGGFVVLVTPEPSVVRASVMAALAMLTILLGRPSAGVAVLSLAVTGLLIWDPWLASTPGFALSALATAALLVVAPPLMRGLTRWMPRVLALAISVPLSAQLVCAPVIALFSDQQSLVAVAANLLATPAAPVATVIGLLACLSAPIPLLADLLAAAAWLPSAWIAAVAETTSSLPGAAVAVAAGPGLAVGVAVLSAACGIVIARPRAPTLRVLSAAVLVVAVSIAGARMLLTGPLITAGTPAGWSVAACDVGQGDAFVIRSDEAVALIDAGPAPELLRTCLRQLGVSRVDVFVLTHFDLDHAGGSEALTGRVGTVLHGPTAELADARRLAKLSAGGAEVQQVSAGVAGRIGAASWRVMWPRQDDRVFPAGNDASVVVEVEGGGVPRSVFLGDLSAASQRQLVQTGLVRGPYDVVKVAHHGSADQDAELYRQLAPRIALIGVGTNNDYGHPRRSGAGPAGGNGRPCVAHR